MVTIKKQDIEIRLNFRDRDVEVTMNGTTKTHNWVFVRKLSVSDFVNYVIEQHNK